MTEDRISRDVYFTRIAELSAKRSTCNRAFVGAIAVKDKHIIMSAYNGSPSGMPHCNEIGHLMVNNHCIRTIHAEQNIIIQCAKHGIPLKSSTIYVTHKPCEQCSKLLLSVGVKEIVYIYDYGSKNIYESYLNMRQLNGD